MYDCIIIWFQFNDSNVFPKVVDDSGNNIELGEAILWYWQRHIV